MKNKNKTAKSLILGLVIVFIGLTTDVLAQVTLTKQEIVEETTVIDSIYNYSLHLKQGCSGYDIETSWNTLLPSTTCAGIIYQGPYTIACPAIPNSTAHSSSIQLWGDTGYIKILVSSCDSFGTCMRHEDSIYVPYLQPTSTTPDSIWNMKYVVDTAISQITLSWRSKNKTTSNIQAEHWNSPYFWQTYTDTNQVDSHYMIIKLPKLGLYGINVYSQDICGNRTYGNWFYVQMSDSLPKDSIWDVQSLVDTSTSMVTVTYKTKLRGNTNVDAYHWSPFMNVSVNDTGKVTNHSITFYAPKLGIYEYEVYSENDYGVTTYSYGIYNRYSFTVADSLPADSIYDVHIAVDTATSTLSIDWKTAYDADSRMWMWAVYNMNSYVWQNDTTMTRSHSMTVRIPKVGKYYLNLESIDVYGRDLQYNTFIWTADSLPFDSIINIVATVTDTAKHQITIRWDNLQQSTFVFVVIDLGAISVFQDDTTKTKHHSLTLTVPDTGEWHYEIYVENTYNNNYAHIDSFYMPDTAKIVQTVPADSTADSTGTQSNPADSIWITSIDVFTDTIGSTCTEIKFNTKQKGNSYAIVTPFKRTKKHSFSLGVSWEASDTTLVNGHDLTICGLLKGWYHVVVRSINEFGDTITTSGIDSFEISSGSSFAPVFVNTGMKEKEQADLKFILYPNPSNGVVTLETSVSGVIKLFDVNGKMLFTEKVQNIQTLDLSNLTGGVYFYTFSNDSETKTGKLILN